MNKLYLIVTLIAPIFGFFGTLARWFQPQENKPSMHQQIKRNLIVKNIGPFSSYGKQEESLGVDELGIKVPNIPSYQTHNRVIELRPIVEGRESAFQGLDDKYPAINRQEWDDYRKKRHKKIYHNHKMGIDKHGEPYRLNDEDD